MNKLGQSYLSGSHIIDDKTSQGYGNDSEMDDIEIIRYVDDEEEGGTFF
jgi:hypothetical protein